MHVFCCLLIFISKNSFRHTISVQNFVGPDLDGPKCLQSLSADDTSRQRVINHQGKLTGQSSFKRLSITTKLFKHYKTEI